MTTQPPSLDPALAAAGWRSLSEAPATIEDPKAILTIDEHGGIENSRGTDGISATGFWHGGNRAPKVIAWMWAPGAGPAPPSGPSVGLLMSMAIRFDHALGVPGYYDTQLFGKRIGGEISHEDRLRMTLAQMRQVWEEVVGKGFYKPERDAEYAAMARCER